MDTLPFIETFITKKNADLFIEKAENLNQKVFLKKRLNQDEVNVLFSQSEQGLLDGYLGRDWLMMNQEDLSKKLSLLIEYCKALPVITIEIPIVVSIKFVQQMAATLYGRDDRKFLLEIVTDPAVLAGVIIYKDGLVHDYSLREKLNKIQGI